MGDTTRMASCEAAALSWTIIESAVILYPFRQICLPMMNFTPSHDFCVGLISR